MSVRNADKSVLHLGWNGQSAMFLALSGFASVPRVVQIHIIRLLVLYFVILRTVTDEKRNHVTQVILTHNTQCTIIMIQKETKAN